MHTQIDEFSSNIGRSSWADEAFLDSDTLRTNAPAVFAGAAHESTSPTYAFLSTQKLLDALSLAGFLPVAAEQSATRVRSALHARHVIRLRRRFETIELADGFPELVLLNSHDGTSAYQLRLGIYRVHCRNGLIVSEGMFPIFRVAHRGDILDELIRAALEMAERFSPLATEVQRLQHQFLSIEQRELFAARALELRYPKGAPQGIQPAQLLVARRPEDVGSDAWRTFNTVQENVLRGGLRYVTDQQRRRSTRGISSIKQNVRLNTALWEAVTVLAD
jgi:hypothetical protein